MISPSGYEPLGNDDAQNFELCKVNSNKKEDEIKKQNGETEKEAKLHLPEVSMIQRESMCSIASEMFIPFFFAGVGMVLAGLELDKVQHWTSFQEVNGLYILVPPLLGLKGNIEMTLASRLSTAANLKILDQWDSLKRIVFGNLALCQCQALVVSFLVSIVAILFNWVPTGEFDLKEGLLLTCSAMLTASLASAVLGTVMVLVVIISLKMKINPDNVVTPIAASLGDLITLWLLAVIAQFFYNFPDGEFFVMPLICGIFVLLIPIWAYIAFKNEYTHEVITNGWEPVIAAMIISSGGGFILDSALSSNPGVAVFAPLINGVGGNLAAVFSSRLSTNLHLNCQRGELPTEFRTGCVHPCFLFCGTNNQQVKAANVMLLLVIPGQLAFLSVIYFIEAGHVAITTPFVILYLLASMLQVIILLHIAWWLVHRVWSAGDDPDSVAIPYLTAFGDLIGVGLLTFVFSVLSSV